MHNNVAIAFVQRIAVQMACFLLWVLLFLQCLLFVSVEEKSCLTAKVKKITFEVMKIVRHRIVVDVLKKYEAIIYLDKELRDIRIRID